MRYSTVQTFVENLVHVYVQIRTERIQILPWDVKAKKVKQQEIDRNRRNLIDLINY